MISLLHPSRGRPKQSYETISKWVQRAGAADLEIIISVDFDDPLLEEYESKPSVHPNAFILRDNNKSAVEAINGAARVSKGNIMIVVSDDTDAPLNWAARILKYTEGKRDFVMKVRDGIQPKIITMPLLDRVYYQRFGYIYHPDYSHAWADREFTEVAHKLKRVITKNILFKHNHYSVSKGKKRDAQYERTDATFNKGREIFNRRKSINFGL